MLIRYLRTITDPMSDETGKDKLDGAIVGP